MGTLNPPFRQDESPDFFSSSQPVPPLPLRVPATYHHKRTLRIVDRANSATFNEYLRSDMDVSRLNTIHRHLWLAGLPVCARALHHQIRIGREVVVTEQADLHLTWIKSRLFLKPLPEYIFDYTVWRDSLCHDELLYQSATGLLLSYLWLICNKSDLRIAQATGLLPPQKLTGNSGHLSAQRYSRTLIIMDCPTLILDIFMGNFNLAV
jgi:hypothetical protein